MSGVNSTLVVQGCPFCGGAPHAMRTSGEVRRHTVVVMGCSNPKCATIILRANSFGAAVMQWNNRTASSSERYTLRTPPQNDPVGTLGVRKED